MSVNIPCSIVFLDVDGTLINSYTGPNVAYPKKIFENIQKKGVLLGLNSNRSIEDLLPITEEFGLRGPIIGENGAFVYFPEEKRTDLLISKNEQEKLKKIKRLLPKIIQEFSNVNSFQIKFETTDTVSKLMNPKKINGSEDSIRILNNKFRKYTISAHVQIFRNNSYVQATNLITPIVKFIQNKLSEFSDIAVVGHPTYCNILIYSTVITKRTGIEKIKKIYPNTAISVIGDEIGDQEMIDGIGDFYSVANADSKIKKVAKRASPFKYTRGVIDILKVNLTCTKMKNQKK